MNRQTCPPAASPPFHIRADRIAACLITRNRADLVTRAIESVRPHVDGVFVYEETDNSPPLVHSKLDPERLRWVHKPAPGPKTDPARNYRLLSAAVRADEQAGRPPCACCLFYLAAEIAVAASIARLREDRLGFFNEARRFLRASLRAQPNPRDSEFSPLPPTIEQALPGDLRQMFRRASGVA